MATAQMQNTGQPLQGLTGLYGDPQDTVDIMDEGVLEAHANPLHPDHGEFGSQSDGYSGTVPEASSYSDLQVYDAGMSGQDYAGSQYDTTVHDGPDDITPTSHQAAWPRGIIQPSWENADGAYAGVGDQLRELHGADLGGPEFYVNTAIADNLYGTDWSVERYESTDDILLVSSPDQLKGTSSMSGTGRGAGGADVSQGYGVANSLPEFAHGHSMRYVQQDKMPQDYTNTHGEQDVPFMGRHPIQQMPFNGPDSPYFEMGDIDGANTPWEGRISYPTAYVQPPEPTITAAPPGMDVWAYA